MPLSKKGCRLKGSQWERNCKAFLEKLGFFTVRQSASQFPDLIAISTEGKASFVECKSKAKYLTKKERDALVKLADKHDSAAILMYPSIGVSSKKANNFVARSLK